jgi:5'-methylthioadenosine phosphorylase
MKLGIIGGSGLYEIEDLRNGEPISVDTPFGPPSDLFLHGTLGAAEIYFLARHGRGHRKMPSEINHKANIYGFKKLGVDTVVGISAVGSLREDLRPRDIVLPDQYFDRTKCSLEHTFFGHGLVAHIAFGDPVCPTLREHLRQSVDKTIASDRNYHGIQVRDRGTYVNMEGPAFSTRAESNAYRKMGFDIIGMTSLPEAKLCREAEICYASVSMITDYDCWYEAVESVSVEMILSNLKANTALAHDFIRLLGNTPPDTHKCACHSALQNAMITAADMIPESTKTSLAPIIGKYLRPAS